MRSISVQFSRSASPFCCDFYGAVISDVMPLSSNYALRSLVTHSFEPS